MSHDEFTKLFKYMESFRGDVDQRFDKVEGDIRDLNFNLAELSGRVEDYYNEFLALDHKVDRMESNIEKISVKVEQQGRWTHEIADHTGAALSPA